MRRYNCVECCHVWEDADVPLVCPLCGSEEIKRIDGKGSCSSGVEHHSLRGCGGRVFESPQDRQNSKSGTYRV